MIYDVWVYANSAAWEALDPSTDNVDEYVYNNAITGYWNDDSSGFTLYNVRATAAQVSEFSTALGADFRIAQIWQQGTGKAARDEDIAAYRTVEAEILDVMKELSPGVPATRNDPNWGHVFFGQIERDFAGNFSNAFSKEFY